jgi:hypothetical protein
MLKELQFVEGQARHEVEGFMSAWLDRLASVLDGAVQEGRIRADTPTRDVALALFSAWFVIVQGRFGGRLDREACLADQARTLTAILHGYIL